MSTRRSARTTQPPPSVTPHTNSSTSSVSSGRAERSTRSHHKLPSPRRSIPPRSQSLEDPDDPSKQQLRKTRSRQESINDDNTRGVEDDDDEELDEEEEEEVTRCICGNTDYPGLPVAASEAIKGNKKDSPNAPPVDLPQDAGGLFIQCDTCKVWQHGGCVGILDESMNPDEYFCEQCRKDLHRIATAVNGQKYSRYLPVQDSTSSQPSPEPSIHDNTPRKSRDAKGLRSSVENSISKRRSTMNSRDAAYDEGEQLRRAIEESKKEGAQGLDGGARRNKRARSDSEERKEDTKRQRTISGSSSSPSTTKPSPVAAQSEDEASRPPEPKKARNAVNRTQREKELQEREKEREKERADAAGRRKGRADRRRADDSDLEESYSQNTSIRGAEASLELPASSQPPPDTPPATHDPPPPKPSHHKKTGRPPNNRRGRVGRNQYTRDRDSRIDAAAHKHNGGSGIDADRSPNRSRSRDAQDTTHTNGTTNTQRESGKPSKPKYMNPNRTTMNEMKRRVAAILEFISRMQVEIAGERELTSPANGASNGSTNEDESGGGAGDRGALVKGLMDSLGGLMHTDGGREGVETGIGEREFANLNALQMMDVLTRRLVRWQRDYGKWAGK